MPVKNTFGIISGLLIFALSFWLYGFPQRQAYIMAQARANSLIELGAAAAVKPVLNVKNSLSLLSRLPVLREISAEGCLSPGIADRCSDLGLLVESFELPVAEFWRLFTEIQNAVADSGDVPAALQRRFVSIMTFGQAGSGDADFSLEMQTASAQERDRILAVTQLVPATLQLFADGVTQFFAPLKFAAATIDTLPGFRSATQRLAHPVENLFALMLDGGQLRTLALKNLEGDVLTAVGDVDLVVGDNDNRDGRAVMSGVPFFCGPVLYDQQRHRPVWWVAVPVRDEMRQPVACLSAMVDISYLSQLAEIMTSGPDRLIFAERSGVTIGHHDEQLVAQQVNLGRSLLPALQADDKPISTVVRRNYRVLLQTAASIKISGQRYLPDWFVYSQVDLTSISETESFIILICVILLAAGGVYVLSCCLKRLLNSSHEET
ncbi:MAG TPA: cache domain-containing protein [Candidatus Rifleibacterium sp.]|nr:cache domain-containing protein [Candidatus Rifleibacterium sp.]HPT44457.1 cache domain-containing protein [Candidatus Rifleibacterium sp.]